MVSGARGNAESGDSVKMYGSAVPPAAPTNLPTPPVTQPVSLLGKFITLLLVFFRPAQVRFFVFVFFSADFGKCPLGLVFLVKEDLPLKHECFVLTKSSP